MIWHRHISAARWLALAAFLAGALLGGCAGDRSAPTRAPVAPVFRPQNVVVRLGDHGGATTLISTQGGGWTRNGEPFGSGDSVTGENGKSYRLTYASGGWTAAYVPPEPQSVRLGSSGQSVAIRALEDGTFATGESPLKSGALVQAANGNGYRLTLGTGGSWTAAFVPPPPVEVKLGASGDTVRLERLEDRTYQLRGQPLASGGVVMASNGANYRLTLGGDGMWTAAYAGAPPVRVRLGTSVAVAELLRQEDGSYHLDGRAVASGDVRAAANGNDYRFTLRADGTWIAAFVPRPATVNLGSHGGAVSLSRQEDGRWLLGSAVVRNGHVITGTNGHEYRLLLLADGTWRAEPRPTTVQVSLGSGGSVALVQLEDGTYWFNDKQVRSGDQVSIGNVPYRFTFAGGKWAAVRTGRGTGPTVPGRPDPGEPLDADTLATYVGVTPRLKLKAEDGTGTRTGSIIEINGQDYTVSQLFRTGRVNRETTFVDAARSRITKHHGDIALMADLAKRGASLDPDIEARWDQVAREISTIFTGEGSRLLGANAPRASGTSKIDYDEVVDDVQDVLNALASPTAFEDAVESGVFSRSLRVRPAQADEAYFAVRTIERLGFGWTASTRFGAYSKMTRDRASSTLTYPTGAQGAGGFAYSPLGRTLTANLPRSGEALYRGTAIAASSHGVQDIYSGDIELRVRFGARTVSGLITNFIGDSGAAWIYQAGAADLIRLPTASLDAFNGSFTSAARATGSVEYGLTARSASTFTGAFTGSFVGTTSNQGQAAIGTWKVVQGGRTMLTGGFGADYDLTTSPPPPTPNTGSQRFPPPGDAAERAQTYINARPDSGGDIQINARDADGDRIEVEASRLLAERYTVEFGKSLVAIAKEVVDKQLDILQIYQRVGSSVTARQASWAEVNKSLRDVFGSASVLGATYPSGASLAQRDSRAINTLGKAADALASAIALRDGVEAGGVFRGALNAAKVDRGDYDFDDIYSARSSEVGVLFGYTELTRFGAWSKKVRANAVSAPRAETSIAERPDVFAYSPIVQTRWSATDLNFPRNLTAQYFGETVAVETTGTNPAFYEGQVRMSVLWRAQAAQSTVTALISNLTRISDGARYLHNGYAVGEIVLGSAAVRVNAGGLLSFRGSPSIRVRYLDSTRPDSSLGAGTYEGKFVGYDLRGPRAAIGTWNVRNLKGAFGVDLHNP